MAYNIDFHRIFCCYTIMSNGLHKRRHPKFSEIGWVIKTAFGFVVLSVTPKLELIADDISFLSLLFREFQRHMRSFFVPSLTFFSRKGGADLPAIVFAISDTTSWIKEVLYQRYRRIKLQTSISPQDPQRLPQESPYGAALPSDSYSASISQQWKANTTCTSITFLSSKAAWTRTLIVSRFRRANAIIFTGISRTMINCSTMQIQLLPGVDKYTVYTAE